MIVLLKISPDSYSENCLKIGQYLTKLRPAKNCANFWATIGTGKRAVMLCG